MIRAPGAFEGYSKLVPRGFVNEICARLILRNQGPNPIDRAKDVQCPVLLLICEKDNLVSMDSALRTAEVLGNYAEVKRYNIGHFDIYLGEHFERSVSDQIEFFKRHLMVTDVP
jgi:pimeloyl-ACP methyl ester carboxylesterase